MAHKFEFNSYEEEVQAVQKMSLEEYDEYIRYSVQKAIDDPRPLISNEEVKERMRKHIEKRKAEREAKQ